MFKEQLLKEILEFTEKKRKVWFTKEEFLVHLWYKYNVLKQGNGVLRFETIIRQLRQLAREGFLQKKKNPIPEWEFTYYIMYYPNRNKIKSYLARLERNENRTSLMVFINER